MKYLLDTNICVYIIRQRPPWVRERFNAFPIGDIGISSISMSELSYGVAKSSQPERNHAALDRFLLPLTVLPYDSKAAQYYGGIRANLEKTGTPIGPLDLLIAAHALSLDVTLVSNNTKEFARVTGLRLVNWADE